MELDEGSRQPFTSLQSLDISHNQITDEEGLLALTAWPALRVLNITDNPLTRRHKSTPPVIEHHLQKLCGVHIQRLEAFSEKIRYWNRSYLMLHLYTSKAQINFSMEE